MKSTILFLLSLLCSPYVYGQLSQDSLLFMKVGGKYVLNFNEKGTKALIAECINVSYSDSTEYSCRKTYTVKFYAIGKDIPLGTHGHSYGLNLMQNGYLCTLNNEDLNKTLKKGENTTLSFHISLRSTQLSDKKNALTYEEKNICYLDNYYDNSIYIEKEKERQKQIYEEHKRKQEELYKDLFPTKRDSPEFDLTPENIINYIGKVTREEFEELVGPALDNEDDFIVYEVKNKFDEIPTAIRCYYRESDGKLISLKFPTPHYLSYWIGFTKLNGYPKTEAIAKKNGNFYYKKDTFDRIYQINFKLKTFGCQILNIKQYTNYSTAIINYHIVK